MQHSSRDHARRPPAGSSGPRRRTLWLPLVAALVVIGAIGLLWASGSRGEPAAAPETQAPTSETESPLRALAHRTEGDPLAIGDPDAPVVMIEWADYRCPFCGVFARDVQPALVQEYVERGDLRIEWRDLPVFGEQSEDAAIAGRAAAAQGRFWEFHEQAFAVAPERGHADLDREALLELARAAGVPDLARFEADLESPQLREAVLADLAEGQSLGITGTPTFVVGETPVIGAQPLEAFREVIEAEIAAAR